MSSNTGYANIAKAKASGKKVVTFYWRTSGCSTTTPCGAFADYRDLFGLIYPGFALKGSANGCGGGCTFNQYWHTGVVGNDNKPISDGPFYMQSYTPGQGMLLKKNPHWYGAKAKLSSIAFKIITDTNSEIQAMKGGEVDAIAPSPESALCDARASEEPQVQRRPQLHPGALGHPGQSQHHRVQRQLPSRVEPAAHEAVHPAGDR